MDRIDYIKDSLERLHDKIDDLSENYEGRIDTLEKKSEHQRGFVTGAGVIITAFSGLISFLISHLKG